MGNMTKIPTSEDVSKSDGSAEKLNNTLSLAQGELELVETLGYQPELRRNRSMFTLLFQAVAIAAVPFGIGGPLISSIYGGGQLSIFIGWISCCILAQCVGLSIAELASRYPTSAGPYYWSFQVSSKSKVTISYINGWIWLAANWTISLGVNFGFASILAATITMYKPEWEATSWQLTLIFWALLLVTFLVCTFADKWMPMVDTIVAAWTLMTVIVILVALSVKARAGRHSASYALTNYDKSLSGWGDFTFFIGLLPSAYTFAAVGMISVMAEQVDNPQVKVPKAISYAVPVEALCGLIFILPICFTLPPLEDIASAPYGQALPVIFELVMGSRAGALGLMVLILVLTLTCSFSITIAASRTTWAFARDNALPFSNVFSRVDKKHGVPVNALILVSVVQGLLGLINFGSTFAFTAFVSVGVMGLEASYLFPILISLLHGRKEVNQARFTMGPMLGLVVNSIAVVWILFQVVLFSMPTVLPVTETSMNYASVVFVGCGFFYHLVLCICTKSIHWPSSIRRN